MISQSAELDSTPTIKHSMATPVKNLPLTVPFLRALRVSEPL